MATHRRRLTHKESLILVSFRYGYLGDFLKTALVVPCTKSKSRPVPSTMCFGALPTNSCAEVTHYWLKAASQVEVTTSAKTLYTGSGWRQALRAHQLMGPDAELWAASAGFGLVAGDEELPSYAATFASEENRVADRLTSFSSHSSAHAAWWESINDQRGRTKTPLQSTFTEYDRVVVALSAPYLAALIEDLERGAKIWGPERLWLIAVSAEPSKLSTKLRQCLVPLTSKMEQLINSPRATLNISSVVWWLDNIVSVEGWSRVRQNKEVQKRLATLKPAAARVKRSLNDDEVLRWIEEQKQVDPNGGKTRLLQMLRASGRACEQNRFSRVYAEVTKRP